MHRSERLLRSALTLNNLIEKDEKVAVGISGGADSLCLLLTLCEYSRRYHKNWQIHPIHINPGFANWNTDRVERICQRLGLTCTVKMIDVPKKLKDTKTDSCFFCARERRKILFQTATELNCRKVALGHHLEDVNETFLLNLFFTSSSRTILPRQPLFKGAIVIVRPLYYFTEEMIRTRLKAAGIRPVLNFCPYKNTNKRAIIRRFLTRVARTDHRIQNNIFWGIHNLKSNYLPKKIRP
ncbi:MAG: tRNA lysidine(34) synthetase [bacterium]